MSYTPIENIDMYTLYYNSFQPYNNIQLITLCEKNNLSIEGPRELLLDRLAFKYSEMNKPPLLYNCIKSIKKILYIS